MGFLKSINSKVTEFWEDEVAKSNPVRPRELTDADHSGWQDALDARMHAAPAPRTIEEVRKAVSAINPIRFHQCRSDLKWVEKQMKKLGLNPDDARHIL